MNKIKVEKLIIHSFDKDKLYNYLNICANIVELIPDKVKVEFATELEGKLTVKPAFSFIAGAVDLHISKVVTEEKDVICYKIKSKSVGTGSEVDINLLIYDKSVSLIAEVVSLYGLIKLVPQSLIITSIGILIDQMFNKFKDVKLE